MKSSIYTLASFLAYAAAGPIAVPAGPQVTKAAHLEQRQDALSCTITSTLEAANNQWGIPTATNVYEVCSCSGDLYPAVTTSLVTDVDHVVTTSLICGDYTTRTTPEAPITYTAKPTVATDKIQFGNVNPSAYIFQEIGVACAIGACPTTGSTTGFYVADSTSGGTVLAASATPITITWATVNNVNAEQEGDWWGYITTMMGSVQESNAFQWQTPGDVKLGNYPNSQTNYMGPSMVQIRQLAYQEDGEQTGEIVDLSIAFANHIDTPPAATCSEITGPIDKALSLIPEIASLGDLIGTICTIIDGAT